MTSLTMAFIADQLASRIVSLLSVVPGAAGRQGRWSRGSSPRASDHDEGSRSRAQSGYLTIRAERSDKIEGKHRSEFRYGSSTRSLALPVTVDEDNITASYRDGILTVSVGLKTEKKTPAKKIEVTSGK